MIFPITVCSREAKCLDRTNQLSGPILAYLSPDPPTENSFVKIFEKGKYEEGATKFAPGKWAISSELKANNGLMNVRIPAGLKAGKSVKAAKVRELSITDLGSAISSVAS